MVDADGRCLRTAVLGPLSGREEEWLALHTDAPNSTRVTHLLRSCLRSLEGQPATTETAGRLLLADRDYLVLQLRRLTLGDPIMAVFRCSACSSRMDVDLAVSQVPVRVRPQQAASYSIELPEGGGRMVSFRLPTGDDQEAIVRAHAGASASLPPSQLEGAGQYPVGQDPQMAGMDEAADALLDRCLLSDGGQPLSVEDRCAVGDAMGALAPEVELELELACPECGHVFLVPFDTTAFFLEEMRMRGHHLLREVHTLAAFYHWSESDILDLQRDRRRAYLHLVSEATRVN
jgi:DNA-directed RNA polymerase subunit RPC12/RpoP